MLLAVERLHEFGWRPQFGSRAAIVDTARWLDENY
jgi:nucleoside-diphosphate-sugar epimerase